ncbi:Autophagy-related protein 2 [Lasiodiplodia theobromae]|uniref:Autophagy-related protein 2 n=1 Tax=Lasiodiplodia theobromae TaxID=45133 RepID=A0A5N5CUP7_9PEZI|nr:Autophagy-related protein 2 [Lasiodiplodia theobromae]
MYSRRSHRNSHHGCRECKERRVKCDETQPRCLRCKSKGRKCTYTHLLSQYNPFDPHQNQATTPSLTSPQQQPLICRANRISAPGRGNGNTVSFWDMSLLDEGGEIFHHYVHVVTITDPTHRVSEGFWRWDKAVQAFAPSHDFLYYAVLTFASLHRSELYQRCINNKSNSNAAAAASARQQRDHLVALASAYQSRAIASFTPAVTEMQRAQKRNKGLAVRKDEVGSQNASATDAVLTCSSLILAAAFAFPPAPGQDMIDRARQVIHLFLGTFALYERAWEEDDDGENRGPSPSPSPTTSSFAAGGTSDIGAYVRDRVRAGEELGDGLPAPEAEASLERVVDAVLLRAATSSNTNTSAQSSSSSNSYSCSTFLAMLNPTLLYQSPLSPSSSSSPSSPPPPPLDPSSPLPTFLPPIQALRLLFRRLQARPALHTIALRWPAHLPRSFLAALERDGRGRSRDPLALVVLAHWARCLAGFTHLWWISQWGAKVVRAVAAEVLGRGDDVGGGGGLGGEASSSGVVEGGEEEGWAETTLAAGSGSVGRERSGGGAGGSGGMRVVAEAAEAAGETGGGAVAAAAAAEANAWRACLEWPVRGLGDAEAACWYR